MAVDMLHAADNGRYNVSEDFEGGEDGVKVAMALIPVRCQYFIATTTAAEFTDNSAAECG